MATRKKTTKKKKSKIKRPRKEPIRASDVKFDASQFPILDDETYLSLPFKEQRFLVNMFLAPMTGWSATRCYQDAFKGCSYRAAATGAYELRRKPDIIKCLEALKKAHRDLLHFKATDTLTRMREIIDVSVVDLFNEDGELITNPHDWPEHVKPWVKKFQEIKVDERGGTVSYKIEFYSKLEAEKIGISVSGTHAPKKLEVSGPDGGPVQIDWGKRMVDVAERLKLAPIGDEAISYEFDYNDDADDEDDE